MNNHMKLITNLPKHNKIYKDCLYSFHHDYTYEWLMEHNKQCGFICQEVYRKMLERDEARN